MSSAAGHPANRGVESSLSTLYLESFVGTHPSLERMSILQAGGEERPVSVVAGSLCICAAAAPGCGIVVMMTTANHDSG